MACLIVAAEVRRLHELLCGVGLWALQSILLTRALASHALKMQNPAPDDAVVIRPAKRNGLAPSIHLAAGHSPPGSRSAAGVAQRGAW